MLNAARTTRSDERISTPYADKTIWVCVCGNEPCEHGFQPCEANGKALLAEDGVPLDDGPFWRCGKCSRVYTPEGELVLRSPSVIA